MRRMTACAVVLVASLPALLFPGAAHELRGQDPPERTWLPEPELLRTIEDVEGDVLGWRPSRLLASPGGGFVAVDWGDQSVRTYTAETELLWQFGQVGDGPGEFTFIADVEYDSNDDLVIVDRETLRLTIVSPDGQLIETIRTDEVGGTTLLPSFSPGTWTVVPRNREEDLIWRAVDERAQIVGSMPLPAAIDFPAPIVSQMYTARTDAGAAGAYVLSSLIVLFDEEGEVRTVVDGIEPVAFPEPEIISRVHGRGQRVPRDAPRAALDVAAHRARIFVRFSGRTEERGRIIDTYDSSEGTYLGSLLLPDPVNEITVLDDGRLLTLETSEVPTLRYWSVQPDVR